MLLPFSWSDYIGFLYDKYDYLNVNDRYDTMTNTYDTKEYSKKELISVTIQKAYYTRSSMAAVQ